MEFENFSMTFRDVTAISESVGMTEVALKILIRLQNRINKQNLVRYTQAELAKKLGVSRQSINTAISILIEKGFMYKVKRSLYKLNPCFTYQNKLNTRNDAIVEYQNEVIKMRSIDKKLDMILKKLDAMATENKSVKEQKKAILKLVKN